jgi:hypothetical protein
MAISSRLMRAEPPGDRNCVAQLRVASRLRFAISVLALRCHVSAADNITSGWKRSDPWIHWPQSIL